jgi:hypothetical protein
LPRPAIAMAGMARIGVATTRCRDCMCSRI